MKYPLFKIVFFLIIGIYIEINYHLFQIETYLFFLFISLSLLFLELVLKNTSYTKKFFSEVLIALSIVFSGILLVDFKSDSQTKNYIGNAKIIKEKRKFKSNLAIYHPIFISQNSVKIKCEVISIENNSTIKKHIGKVLIYLPKDSLSQ